MCVIAVSLKGKKFSEDDLREMWNANPHGAGLAWIKGSEVYVVKGLMKFDDLLEVYENVPKGVMHALHFRLRSAGEILPQLTHPFRIDVIDTQQLKYKAKQVLFHNGTVSDWRSLYFAVLSSLRKKDKEKVLSVKSVSDTYVIALAVHKFGHQILKHLDIGGKWLIFGPEPVFYGSWDDDKRNGFKFSNLSWKLSYDFGLGRSSYGYKSYSTGWKGSSCDITCSWYQKDSDDKDDEI